MLPYTPILVRVKPMIKDERGFTYPLTFSIILLFALFMTMYIEFFLLEVRFFKESETLLKQEYYFLSAVIQLETIFVREEEELFSGIFTYKDGEISYETSPITETLYMTTFTLQMASSPEIVGYSYFDKEEGKMIKWLERN